MKGLKAIMAGAGGMGAHRRLALLLLASTVLFPGGALAQATDRTEVAQAATVSYAIPPSPLGAALAAFGDQSDLQVLYPADLARGRTSPGLTGSYTPEEALRRLLTDTGLDYRFTGDNTVTLVPAAEGSYLDSEDSAVLGPVTVSARSDDPADVPFETPGSSVFISREQIDRLPPTSLGDIFKSTTGVISAGNRSGTGLDINIRGLQGMNRVATLIDGTQQGTTNYIGYHGNTSSTYIDPDFIGGIDITKGPSGGPYGSGAMGGVVNMRTLEAGDIVQEGQDYGFRLKGTLGSNTIAPVVGDTNPSDEAANFLAGDSYAFNVAGAVAEEEYEFVLALSKRKQGNYLAGENGSDTFDGLALSPFDPGTEVYNTSEDSQSLLTKGKVYFGESHSIELGYIYYENEHGQLDDYQIIYSSWSPLTQYPLTETRTHTLTGKYIYDPAYSDYVDLHVNAWMTDLKDDLYSLGSDSDERSVLTYGSEIYNNSIIETPAGGLSLNYGGQFSRESSVGTEVWAGASPIWIGPSGKRTIASLFSQASLEITDWLTVAGGLRYDYYDIEQGTTYLAETYPGQDGTRVNPTASVTVTPFDGIQVYGLYAEGWRPPSLRETSFVLGTTLTPSNNLKPEVSHNFEFGVNVLRDDVLTDGDGIRFKAAYFHNNYDNYIIRYSATGRSPYTWSNIDQAKFQGIELSGGYDMGLVFMEGALTHYTKVEYCFDDTPCGPGSAGTDYGANYVPPETSVSATLGTRLLDETLVMGLRTTFNSERAVSGTLGTRGVIAPTQWPSSTIFDIFASYEVTENVLANLSVENLTNEYYLDPLSITGVPSPGLTVRAGLTFSF